MELERHDANKLGSENMMVTRTGFIIGDQENSGAYVLCLHVRLPDFLIFNFVLSP